jgi:hypothetical protein
MKPYWTLTDEERDALNRSDIEKINTNIEYLNREAEDLLEYQVSMDELFAEQPWETDEKP